MLFLLTDYCFSQLYEVRIKVSDGISTDTLRIGFDPTATNGIDAHLNEFELPPLPPSTVFDTRLFSDSAHIPLGQGVKRDYRPGSFLYFQTIYSKVRYQVGSGSQSIRLTFLGFPLPPNVYQEINIKDFFGGIVVNSTFVSPDTGSVLVTNLAVNSLLITLKVYDPTPVELSSFWASTIYNDVYLKWTTGSEVNNRGFEVQRKNAEVEEWSVISFVNGAVNSNALQEYQYVDRSVNHGSYNYRLKQIDLNGNFEYFLLSEVVNIARPNDFAMFQNYPNPFNPKTTISFQLPKPGMIRLTLFDVNGRLVRQLISNEFRSSGIYEYQLDASELSSGTYYYSLESGNVLLKKSMVLLK
jgi:hypothetical protein